MTDVDEEEIWKLRDTEVQLYFRAKIQEATESQEETWLRVLQTSQVRWNKDRKLSTKLGQDIVRWAEETRSLNALLYHDSAEEPQVKRSLLTRTKDLLASRQEAHIGLLAAMAIGAYTVSRSFSGDLKGVCAGVFAYTVLLVAYVYRVRKEDRKKDSE